MSIGVPWWVQVNLPIGIFLFFLIGTLTISFIRGGEPERRGAMVLLAMACTQYSVSFLLPPHFSRPDIVSASTDMIGFLGFSLIAINARRIWPLWASAFQLLSISGHFARWIELSFPPLVYAWMRTAPTGAAILALLLGTILHMRRLARQGSDPCWQDWRRIEILASIRRDRMSLPR